MAVAEGTGVTEIDSPFQPVVQAWQDLIKRAAKHKDKVFGRTARVCRGFFDGSHDFMYKLRGEQAEGLGMVVGEGIAAPTFAMSLNRVAELVQVFGPTLYHTNPYRHVKPRRPILTQSQLEIIYGPEGAFQVSQALMQSKSRDEAVAGLQSSFLNYLAGQNDLKSHARLAVDEALITGRGVMWHEMYRPGPSAIGMVPYSYYGSVDDLFGDPDGDTVRDWTWCAKREELPRWRVEKEYGLKEGSLRKYARGETAGRQSQVDSSEHGIYRRKQGLTSDVVKVFKIWSKCGLGHELTMPVNDEVINGEVASLRRGLSRFGENVFIVIAEGCPWPLNVPPEEIRVDGGQYTEQEVWERTRWPVPFYEDSDGWPFSELDFHPLAKSGGWPMAHFKPALGEMMAANWIYSFLMGRLHFSSRTLLFYAEHLSDEIKTALESGRDMELIPFQEGLMKGVEKVIQQFQHEPVPAELWRILSELNMLIDKRTGLSELMYGMTGTQMRSATEASVRESATNIRPAAMADTAEDWQTRVAAREGLMARWKCPGQVVASYLGEPPGMGLFSSLWDQNVYAPLDYTNPDSLSRVPNEYEYTIVAGSGKKPNIEKDQENLAQMAQVMVPVYDREFQMTGDPSLMNAYIAKMNDAYKMDTPLLPDRRMEMQMQQQMAQDPNGVPIDPNTGMPVDQMAPMDPAMMPAM